ncbi:MAG: M28 family peptidase [Candidatus Eremiobacteraeota bacterium]|nr:M28 family peptidase [Candidatus Eremiobacteraeota bacterium]
MSLSCALLAPSSARAATDSAASPVMPDARSNVDALVGWPAGARVRDERTWEDRFIAVPSAANAMAIEEKISSVPHRAGTPADYATAQFVRERLQADGFDVTTVPFDVTYTEPTLQQLDLVEPERVSFDLLEGEPGHHTDAEKTAGPAFMENSGDGDVTGPLFYLNHGTTDDWAAFDDMAIPMPANSIVIERMGGFGRDPKAGEKNWEALKKHGVAGLIVYADPADDGVYGGDPWPLGNYKNNFMAERIGGPKPGIGALAPPGDPTLPGEAPVPGKPHLAWSQIAHADIPEINVTQAVARRLLAGMTGTVVPQDWHGGYEMVEHVGGNERVHLAVKMDRRVVTIWNVIGTLRGATKPDDVVMIGSHRDAMAFGAIDPGSGTTVMMQVADGFKRLHDAGWKPDRTIQIASWDGHELGLFGSLSLAYLRGDELRKHVVQYINTDQLTTGPPYVAAMSPELWGFGREIAAYVKDGNGRPIIAGDSVKKPVFVPPGGGSDHMTFIYWLGVPGSSTGYYGHFGAHHSAEDNLAGLATYDPGMKEAVTTAEFTGVQAMRAAGAVDMPLRLTDVATQLLKDVDAARKAPQYDDIDFAPLRAKIATYLATAQTFDAKLQSAERSGEPAAVDALERRAMVARDVFWMPGGLSYNKYWHTIDRLVSPFPELNNAAFDTNKSVAVAAALERLMIAVQKATSALAV